MTTTPPDGDYFHDVAETAPAGSDPTKLLFLTPSLYSIMSSPPTTPGPRQRRHKSLSAKSAANLFACPPTPDTPKFMSNSSGQGSPVTPPLTGHCSPWNDATGGAHHTPPSPRSPHCTFTETQQAQIEALREQVRAMEVAYAEATERDMPRPVADGLRHAIDVKRQEVQELMMRFRTENAPPGLLHSRRWSELPSPNSIGSVAPPGAAAAVFPTPGASVHPSFNTTKE